MITSRSTMPAAPRWGQSGFSLMGIILATVLGAATMIAVISVAMGQAKQTDISSIAAFAAAELQPALLAKYLRLGSDFTALASVCGATGPISSASAMTAGSCANFLSQSSGLRAQLPRNENWSVSAISANRVDVILGCRDATFCAEIKTSIDLRFASFVPPTARPYTGPLPTGAPWQIVVSYPVPA